MNKKIFLGVIAWLFSTLLLSQDVHLSQFYTAQLNLNPALGGNYEGDMRIASNYRNQWRVLGDPITTTMIAVDKRFHFYTDEIDAGIIVIKDQFAGFELNTSKILLSGAYKRQVQSHELRAGIQFGVVLKSTNLETQTFPNQWVYTAGEFDQTVDNLESRLQENQSFIDLNLGVAWSKSFANFKPTVGISMFHVNQPKDTYFDVPSERLRMRKVVHAEAVIKTPSGLTIEPKALMMVGNKAQDLMLGTLIKKHLQAGNVHHIYGGLLYRDGFVRNRDAIIPVVGMRYYKFDIGLSYDINISKLSSESALKSTIELSLVYTAPTFSPKKLSIPCDRY